MSVLCTFCTLDFNWIVKVTLEYTVVVKILHTLSKYLQNVNYYIKIREIIQNSCYFLFSSDLNKIFHIVHKRK